MEHSAVSSQVFSEIPSDSEGPIQSLILHDSRGEHDKWWAAVRFLQREDPYISVLIGLADLRPRWDQLKLLAAGLVIVACILLWIFFTNK